MIYMRRNEIDKIAKINKVSYIIIIACFLVPLYVFLIISIFDKDKKISEKENRTLSSLPKFSFSYLFKDDYTLDFETYYSDTFPLRDVFLTANTKITALYTATYQDKMSIVSITKSDDDFAGENLKSVVSAIVDKSDLSPPSKANTTEKIPENTTSNTTNEPPLPEVDAPTNVQNQGGILIADTRAMELYTNVESYLESYADTISYLQSKVPGVQVFDLVAPTSVEFYSPDEYHTGSSSQKEGIKTLYSHLKNGAIGVDAYTEIRKHIDEYIYFRTDHHWTARGAYYAYVAFSKVAGFDAANINSLESGKLDGFVGTMYMYTQSEILNKNPDYVEYCLPKTKTTAMVYDNVSMTSGYEIPVITTEIEGTGNKYLAFIQGDNPITHIKTSQKNGKKILVVKESYGNSLVPFLCNDYEEVYVVDPRRIDMDLPKFVLENGIQQILCINYMFVPSNPTYMSAFKNIIGYVE